MPEKSLKDVPRPIRDLYEKGKQATMRNNLDYALQLFADVLQKEPGFLECRKELRAAQIQKSGNKSKFFGGLGGANPKLAKAKVMVKNKPEEVLGICEEVLNGSPNTAGAHRLLAEAAINIDLPQTAVWSLELARKISPKDKDIGVALAEAYVANNQVTEAEMVYAELLRANPTDGALSKAYRNLTANKTMSEGGYNNLAEGTGSFRDILKDKDEANKLEQEQRGHKDPEILQRMLDEAYEQLSTDPTPQNARKVADLYFELKDFERALKYYKQILELPGAADPTLEQLVSTCTMKGFENRIAELEEDEPGYTDKLQAIEKERAVFLLEDMKRQADKYPNDLGIRFGLGKLLFQAGKITDAIKELQKSQKDANKRIQSLYYLAQCFSQRNMHDMAARSIETALKEKLNMDEEKKDLIYTYGTILEGMDKKEEAIEQFKQIYEIDIGYRDVSDKIDAFYSASEG